MDSRLSRAIVAEAKRIGANPADLATVMSYETGGTFDQWKRGPTTQWGTHIGLIQMGEPQRKKYGYYKGMPIEDAVRSSANYLVDVGFKPGMGLLEMYSAINAGGIGEKYYGRSDAGNGGAPGTVRDKVNNQMGSHKAKAVALLNGEFTPTAVTSFSPEPGEERPMVGLADDAALGGRLPVSNADIYERQQQGPKPYDSFLGEVGASYDSYSITAQATRWMSEGTFDPEWAPGDSGWSQIKEFPDQYQQFLGNSNSQSTFESRLKWATEDMERVERLNAGGGSSVAAGLVAGAVDPIVSVPSLLTGGAAGAAIGGMSLGGRLLAGSAMGAISNAATDYGSQQIFDDPHADPLMAAGVGALFGALGGALGRNSGAMFEANAALEMAAQRAPKVPTQANATGLPGSAGAARNPEVRDSLIGVDKGYAAEIRDEDVAVGFGGVLRKGDITGQMTTASNPMTRLIGQTFFEETAGFKDHSVVRDSVNSRYTAHHRKLLGNFNVEYGPAKNAYIAEGDMSKMNLWGRAEREREFNRKVSDYVWDPSPSPDTNPNIVKAGNALRKGFATYAEDMRRTGLWDGGPDKNYLPLIANHDRIAELDRIAHQSDVERFIKSAIREHSPEIADDLASRMARGYWGNLRRSGYGMEDGMSRSLHLNDREAFKRSFNEALDDRNILSDEEMEKVFNLLSDMVDDAKTAGDGSKGVSRLKRRTLLDYNFSAPLALRDGTVREGFKVRDMFEDDAELLFRRYARQMSGRVSFADTKIFNPSNGEVIADGIRSETDLESLKTMLKESYRLMPGTLKQKDAELSNALENIDFGWKRINGIPVYGQEKDYAQWVRRLKSLQFTRLMSNMGLNQIQESWKIMSLTGFRAAISQMPAIKAMTRSVAEGKTSGDKLLKELADMTGIGMDNLWSRYDLRMDDDRIGASGGGQITRAIDNMLDYGSQLTTNVSLMRHIHDYQQRWAMKAITQQMVGMARKARTAAGEFDYSRIKQRDRDRLASIGLGEDDAKSLFKNLLDHSEFDGGKIVGVNVAKWDPEAVSKFRLFMGRYTDRLVQQNDFGALSKWMSHPVASLFTQFRSFVFGAWAKSTLWTANHGIATDPRMVVLVLGEIAAGSATYAVRQAGTAMNDWDKYWDETMDPINLAKNGWARTATSSVLPMFIDSFLAFTPVEAQFSGARSSGSATNAWLGSPVVDNLNSLASASSSTSRSLMNGDELSHGQIRSWQRLLPLGNWVPFTAATGALIKDRAER